MSVNASKREGALKVKQVLGKSPLAPLVDEYVAQLGECRGKCDDIAAQVDGVNECMKFLQAKCSDPRNKQTARLGDTIRLGKAAGVIRELMMGERRTTPREAPPEHGEVVEMIEESQTEMTDDDGDADRQN